MIDKMLKIVWIILTGIIGTVLFATGIAEIIEKFKWWSIVIIPLTFVVFEIGLIFSIVMGDWFIYAIKNKTFKGYFSKESEVEHDD